MVNISSYASYTFQYLQICSFSVSRTHRKEAHCHSYQYETHRDNKQHLTQSCPVSEPEAASVPVVAIFPGNIKVLRELIMACLPATVCKEQENKYLFSKQVKSDPQRQVVTSMSIVE